MFEALAALVAKIAGAGAVTQATAGLGIAVAGVTGAGAVGALPTPVQNTVAVAVETVTPFNLPDSADVVTPEPSAPTGPSDVPAEPTMTDNSTVVVPVVEDSDDPAEAAHTDEADEADEAAHTDEADEEAREAAEDAAEQAREDADNAAEQAREDAEDAAEQAREDAQEASKPDNSGSDSADSGSRGGDDSADD